MEGGTELFYEPNTECSLLKFEWDIEFEIYIYIYNSKAGLLNGWNAFCEYCIKFWFVDAIW